MHFMKPVWHSLTANLLPLAVPFFLFLFLTFVFNHHLFSLTSLFPLFTSPSPVLFLATISFPLLSSPSFLCSALLLIFCPIHEVLLPEGVFKLHPAKKKKAPQNPSSSQSQLTECYFLRLCLHDSVGGYLLLFFLFFFFSWFGESWAIFAHCGTCMFTLSFCPRFLCTLTNQRWLLCVLYHTPAVPPPPLPPYPPPPSFWPISIVAPPHWQPCISSSLPYVKVSG